MRIAVLHDYLNQLGGAERVLKTILDIFPDADVYTLLYDKERTNGIFEGRNIKTSFLDIPFIRRRHRAFIPFMPIAAGMLGSGKRYDLIVSSTAGYGKGIGVNAPYHISYCHSPLRYAWEIDYLKNLSFSPRPMGTGVLRPIAEMLKSWDKRASKKVNLFIANSEFIAKKVRFCYGRDANVIYPPVDEKIFHFEERKQEDFYLMVGRLLYFKGFDLGIEAFNRMKKKLIIIGRGPEEKKLKSIANPSYIKFINSVSDDDLRAYYNSAKALLFPQVEDFGLVAAEAQMCGLPVLSFFIGGGSEIVIGGKTGIFFREQSPESIIAGVKEFESKKFNRREISDISARFSEERFKREFLREIKQIGFSNI